MAPKITSRTSESPPRRSMRPGVVWLVALGVGALAASIAIVTGFIGFVFILLVVPGLGGRTLLTAMSGVLIGFGATWLLLARPERGPLNDPAILLLVGLVPLALGVVLGVLALAVSRRSAG